MDSLDPELPPTPDDEPAELDEPTDPEAPEDLADDESWQRPVDRFRQTSVGSVLAAGMLGLGDVLAPRREREPAAMVTEAPGEPESPKFEMHLDPEHPERSVVIIHRAEPDAG